MSDMVTLLDQAIEMGHKELGFLISGDVFEAEQLAQDRGRLTADIENGKSVDLDTVLDKLTQLKALQGQITQEARRLHAALKADLQRVRRENQRFSAYKEGSRVASPLSSRFISRQG
ncbi:hypothetical protein M7784_14325 [Desulfovibrio aminophilus]|nr:hypothetical protein [Desulfovibrio aminophilus]MCM0756409.1 hypothetical protein [Desulfovibrio aminophilus]